MQLVISDDAKSAGEYGALLVACQMRKALLQRPRFSLALSGGATAGFLLEALRHQDLRWDALDVFQVDERVVPMASGERNLALLDQILVADGPLPASQLFSIPVDLRDASAMPYAALLQRQLGSPPIFDVVHLGLGDDGHTASLVPGDAALTSVSHDALITEPYRGARRVTLTFPAINRARRRLWLVTGVEKKHALSRLLAGDRSIPAGQVVRRASIVIADRMAAPDKPPKLLTA